MSNKYYLFRLLVYILVALILAILALNTTMHDNAQFLSYVHYRNR